MLPLNVPLVSVQRGRPTGCLQTFVEGIDLGAVCPRVTMMGSAEHVANEELARRGNLLIRPAQIHYARESCSISRVEVPPIPNEDGAASAPSPPRADVARLYHTTPRHFYRVSACSRAPPAFTAFPCVPVRSGVPVRSPRAVPVLFPARSRRSRGVPRCVPPACAFLRRAFPVRSRAFPRVPVAFLRAVLQWVAVAVFRGGLKNGLSGRRWRPTR